jgi:ADP-heptose:LPS heptosyltransferase
MLPSTLKKWIGLPITCENPKSIFVGLIGGVGDLIVAAPSVAALKRKYPEAKLTFGVGDGIFFSTIKNDPNIDHFETPFSYNVWKKRGVRKTYREKYKEHDLVFLLDNGNRNWWKAEKHLLDVYAEKCGVTLEQRRPLIYLSDKDIKEAQSKLNELGISKNDKLMILSPETRSKKKVKEWPHDRFISLIEKINKSYDFKIITLVSKENPYDFNGTISLKGYPLGLLSAIIKKADFYLGLDNGLSHIASCFDLKMISIHIGYPVECSRPLSPFATTIVHKPFDPPETISVQEVFETFKTSI